MRFVKQYAEHLVQVKRDGGRVGDFEWILKGSESYNRYPHYNFKNPVMGINTYGTKKVNGETCVSIANQHVEAAKKLGWRIMKVATHYAYILPPLPTVEGEDHDV